MEAANARAALHARVAAQRILQACSALFLKIGGSERAFARAKMRRNVCVSSDHLPPTSPAKTTRRARERRGLGRPTPGMYALSCAGPGPG